MEPFRVCLVLVGRSSVDRRAAVERVSRACPARKSRRQGDAIRYPRPEVNGKENFCKREETRWRLLPRSRHRLRGGKNRPASNGTPGSRLGLGGSLTPSI